MSRVATCRRPPICVESARQKKANERPHLDLSVRSSSQPDRVDHFSRREQGRADSELSISSSARSWIRLSTRRITRTHAATMSSPRLNDLLSGLHLNDDDVPAPRNNRQMATKNEDTVTSLIDENIHLKNQLCARDSQIANLAARLEALERRSSPSPFRIKTPPVSPRAPRARALPQPPRQERPQLTVARREANFSPVRMPDPPEFDNNKVDFSRWLVKMRLKLDCELDGHSERFKIQYITSRTTDGPFERLHPRRFASADDCLNQLNDWYGERHRESRAWNELSNLRQHNTDTFADFFAQFEQLLAYVTLPESVQINLVLDKLSSRYADKVEDGTSYATLGQLIHRCYALDAGFAREDARNNTFYDDYDTDEIQEME
ncbi:hypothetical protein D6C97_10544 [Aureobasidium pullulans]|nr:hypothetical protein D6C97_10544 [Aureobasidium pullulans]